MTRQEALDELKSEWGSFLELYNDATLHKQMQRMYRLGYEDARKESLELDRRSRDIGREDAWMCAREVAAIWSDTSDEECKDIFGWNDIVDIFKYVPYFDAIQKVIKYQEDRKKPQTHQFSDINVGDEVNYNGDIGVVLTKETDVHKATIMFTDGTFYWVSESQLTKTGRNFSKIAEGLEEVLKERR